MAPSSRRAGRRRCWSCRAPPTTSWPPWPPPAPPAAPSCRGAGTGLTGAANAVDGCVLLSMHRMREVLEIDTTNRMVRVQPGLLNAELKEAVAAHGLFYPPDPASVDICSIGGNVATNAGGLCCVRYGVTRDYVVGLEVVLATGEVVRTGRRTIKSTAGLDLTGLFVGSEGTLGIITEVTLKLLPAPPPPCTAGPTSTSCRRRVQRSWRCSGAATSRC
ncbi:MAG: FAD-binding protein [Acidimicrobiales bacterium]